MLGVMLYEISFYLKTPKKIFNLNASLGLFKLSPSTAFMVHESKLKFLS